MVTESDLIKVEMTDEEVEKCLSTALKLTKYITDREDLHPRSYLERFIDVAMGELSEAMVIKCFHTMGKYAESTVDKDSKKPWGRIFCSGKIF